MTRQTPTIESSVLLQRMQRALDEFDSVDGTLHVSVASAPKWERSENGDEVLVRWLCWSIESADREINEPEFDVVSQHVTQELLADELPKIFPKIKVVVDDDISP